MKWTPRHCAEQASELLQGQEPRWSHVTGVARAGMSLAGAGSNIPDVVVGAAWLHDIGYAEPVASTSLHAYDGAMWLLARGAPDGLVALVAHHSGARFEAEERGMGELFSSLPAPDVDTLDLLTMLDMTTDPWGRPVSVGKRLVEILARYPADDPVHRAVLRSGPLLVEAASRAAARLGLADVRSRPPL